MSQKKTSYQIHKFSAENKALLQAAFLIRLKIFVEEQNVPKEEECDIWDASAVHFLLQNETEKAVATARYRETSKGIKIERMAVLQEERGKRYAHNLLIFILKDIFPSEKKIYLHSQITAENLYAKYGFVRQGKNFTEAGIEHCVMIFNDYPKMTR